MKFLRQVPFLAAVALVVVGCAGPRVGRTVDSSTPSAAADTIARVSEAGPFYERVETASGAVRNSVRPLLHTRIETPGGARLREVLWPLYDDRLQNREFNARCLITWYTDTDVSDPNAAWHVWAFPFWFQGRSRQGKDYAALFPLGGTMRDFFLYDSIRFALFPLWAATERAGIRSTHILWPIFSRAEGRGHHNLRIFPLWGRVRKDGAWDRTFFLWPLWNQARYERDEAPAGFSWLLFPIGGHVHRPTVEAWHFLPPLFQVSRGRGRFEGDRQILAPWPLVRISDVRGVHKRHFFPFYASTRSGADTKTHILWPFWRHDHDETGALVRDDWSLAPLFHRTLVRSRPSDSATDDPEDQPVSSPLSLRRSYTRLWPLFSHVDEGEGSFLRILDFSLQRRVGTLERNLLQMPVIYTHGRNPASGTREDELLWGLWRWRRDDLATREFLLWPLFRRARPDDASPETIADWSVGSGLAGRETDPTTGARRTRLLWFLRW